MSEISEGILLGLCNPLLDITCDVDKDFLDKYGLKADDAILADETHKDLYKDITIKFKCRYVAGGSAQNTLRAVQWILNKANITTFMGAIGDDHFGQLMAHNSKTAGLNAVYMIDESTPTGTCACLVSNNNTCRSLVAYLGASQKFRLSHVENNFELVEKAKFIYVSGYFLVVSPETALYLAKHVNSNENKMFSINLSAPYISQVFSKPLLEIFPFVDLVFGNETEAQAFAHLNEWKTTDMKEIAKLMANMECKRKSGRIVVVTQGKDDVLVASTSSDSIQSFSIDFDQNKIVDTIGAGDAFVGGFFAHFIQNKSFDFCIESGIKCAQEVIQEIGAHFPVKS